VSNAKIRHALLDWYSKAKRDLPWRHQKNAYAIWVSEVMLQQTQVSRVVLYFEKFLARFPSVETLAACELSEMLTYWQGLGYYSRARNLTSPSDFKGSCQPICKPCAAYPGLGAIPQARWPPSHLISRRPLSMATWPGCCVASLRSTCHPRTRPEKNSCGTWPRTWSSEKARGTSTNR
jgi:HhH-GPD superfamily base excision DNA repair protein